MNTPELGKWQVWKIDFSRTDKDGEPMIENYQWLKTLRLTPNGSLAVQYVDRLPGSKNKIFYVPQECINGIDAPVWFPTNKKKYGYIFRPCSEPIPTRTQLALIASVSRTN